MVKSEKGRVVIMGNPMMVQAEMVTALVSYAKAIGKSIEDTVLLVSNEALKMSNQGDSNAN